METIQSENIYFNTAGAKENSRASALRAVVRLHLLFFITLSSIIHLQMRKWFSTGRIEVCASMVQKWAANLNRVLGIKVSCTGSIPEDAMLVISNHRSYIDITVIAMFIPCSFMAKHELRGWPLFGTAAHKAGIVFVKRGNRESGRLSQEAVIDLLQKGISFVVFPEGTTTAGPGTIDFKNGIFNLAADNNITILPAAIEYEDKNDAWIGTDTFVSHFFRTFGKKEIRVRVSFGTPVKGENPEKLKNLCRDNINNNLKIQR